MLIVAVMLLIVAAGLASWFREYENGHRAGMSEFEKRQRLSGLD